MRSRTFPVLLAIVISLTPSDLIGQDDLGTVRFETSCSPEVQADFERGLALLHHMMYEQADGVFKGVAADDPFCAMAYWGMAMTSSIRCGRRPPIRPFAGARRPSARLGRAGL